MKTGIVVLAAISLGGWAWAGLDNTNQAPQELRLELNLLDGSRIIGVPTIESVPVQTSYAKMDVPLGQLINIKIGEDHETASLDLRNGDRMKGVITLEPISLETAFGRVSVGVEFIREIRVAMASAARPEALRQGLVLYLPFDDDSRLAKDLSGLENHGTVQDAVWVRNGKSGGAYDFRGEYGATVVVGHEPSMKAVSEWTIMAWVNLRTVNNGAIISKWYSSPVHGDYLLGLHPDGNLRLTTSQSDAGYKQLVVTSRDRLPLNRWVHVAGVFYSGTLEVYIDGRMVGQAVDERVNRMYQQRYKNDELRIGGAWTGQEVVDGMVDEVMVYNRALSSNEVASVVNSFGD